MEDNKKSVFDTLNDINVSTKLKQKIGLNYLSWADAWAILKKNYPDSEMTVYTRTVRTTKTRVEHMEGEDVTTVETDENEVPYFTDGKTCYVKVGVTINEKTYIELLPVMDNRNAAVPLAMINMTVVNKAIQRCFVKACARAGLGLYVYAGEDLPDIEKKVIDFKSIGENCDRFTTIILNDDGFETMKKSVIALVQNGFPESQEKGITDYILKTSKGKRLSLFTNAEDSQALQRINNFIAEVKKAADSK